MACSVTSCSTGHASVAMVTLYRCAEHVKEAWQRQALDLLASGFQMGLTPSLTRQPDRRHRCGPLAVGCFICRQLLKAGVIFFMFDRFRGWRHLLFRLHACTSVLWLSLACLQPREFLQLLAHQLCRQPQNSAPSRRSVAVVLQCSTVFGDPMDIGSRKPAYEYRYF